MKAIPGFEGYFATKDGKIYSKKMKNLRPITLCIATDGYQTASIVGKNGKQAPRLVHRLVALTYLPNPTDLPVVNHKDGKKLNNHLSNLEWVTRKRNCQHAIENNLIKIASRTVYQLSTDGEILKEFPSIADAAKKTATSRTGISDTCRGRQRVSNGFGWCYKENYTGEKIRDRTGKRVGQYTLKDELVTVYQSTISAARNLGIAADGITAALAGKRKTSGGFKWKFETEEDEEEIITTEADTWAIIKVQPDYRISRDGRIYSIRRCIYLKTYNTSGKAVIKLNRKHYLVHRLVAMAYLPNPHKYPVVNHLDGNKFNNTVENLEWCTQRRNTQHAHDTGLNTRKKITIQLSAEGDEEIERFESLKAAFIATGISTSIIRSVATGKQKLGGGYGWRYA